MSEPAAPSSGATPAAAPAAAPRPKVTAQNFGNSRRAQNFDVPAPTAAAVKAGKNLNDLTDDAGPAPAAIKPEPEVDAPDLETAPEAAVEAEPEVEVAPEAEGDTPAPAAEEDVHGIPVSEVLAALREGKLPDALWNALKMELVDGEDREEATLADYRDSVMLHRNYTRKRQAEAARAKEVEATAQAVQAEKQEFYQMVKSW